MRVLPVVAIAGAILVAEWAYAADSLTGSYTGSIMRRGGPRGASLVIHSVQDGVVKGTATRTEKNCAGDFPVEGKLEGNKLKLTAVAKGGRGGDCNVDWDLTVEGNKLTGTSGSSASAIELSK